MTETIIKYIVEIVIIVAVVVVGRYLIPYVKAKLTAAQFDTLMEWVETAVKAAEQIFTGSGRGTEKKEWVENLLSEIGVTVDEAVDAMIEASVLEL